MSEGHTLSTRLDGELERGGAVMFVTAPGSKPFTVLLCSEKHDTVVKTLYNASHQTIHTTVRTVTSIYFSPHQLDKLDGIWHKIALRDSNRLFPKPNAKLIRVEKLTRE